MSMGWTLDYVKWNVDLPTLAKLSAYWRKFPPMHVLLARYVGHKPEVTTVLGAAPSTEDEASAQSLFSNAPEREFPKPIARTNGN